MILLIALLSLSLFRDSLLRRAFNVFDICSESAAGLLMAKVDRVAFPPTMPGERHTCKVELKNKSRQDLHVTIRKPQAPFYAAHSSFTVK